MDNPETSSDNPPVLTMAGDYGNLANSLYPTEDDTLTGGTEEEIGGEDKSNSPLREQDRFLPIANVSRIMKNGIPKSGKISKEAKECVQECVSEFISFITSEASDRCHQEKRKTINGEDILYAMSTLGFDNYVEPLKLYLQKYRDSMKGEKSVVGMTTTTIRTDSLEDLQEQFGITGNLISGDQTVPPAYTTAYPTQLSFSLEGHRE
ncbi:nuclear transcription factor Y subunit beta-like [Acanthaster planci]|uniref:Nuclear transcription factor Y subunit beta n=1 Tax=Acanthaster planci TaxID=133434 RepID=A0A8B7Z148_ACAPL|nr:nuclear transcription factor Y subunit beta-like [Acanthaster planci]XP_022099249.1 nuclear transcription factor Y subunit beta-like [Acanthaster planci]XP_022099258.1 nuclear transcription factor Y subunit beta-like [Acanthaster planci]XP_022099267.1 nuclear transcription factor Y subunit beta-like [Acanthaster planci]XP_022099275.1 nuclear transcription factor Y subunit beta-like [Acanthaster planci]XP_022099282.1 nuclear transcription factor Y subunit beta-like [Acanthaster planci]XP_02